MAKKKGVSSEKAKAKEAKKAKAEKKAEKRETKKTKGGSARPGADDEEDLDAILEKLAKEWEAKHKVNEETVAGPPTRRANATLTPCPSGNHLWFIGGEYFSEDGKAHFYNDVYRYTPEKDEWRCYTSPNSPGPRSAHSVVASPAGGGRLFLFGGEFSSLSQNTFHHYRDFWVFDVATHSWDRIETKIKPIARSGHRMALWKHFIVLFGGFVDIGVRTNYLNDLWLFDTQEYKWIQVEFGPNDRQPHSRSGFSFLPIAEGVIMHGGYTKTYDKGKRPVGVALEDTWFLKMSLNPKEIKWEKRKKIGYAPSPARSGCSMALWAAKAQGVLFGGVSDVDKDEEQLDSVFYNDMFGYQTSGNGRWVSMNLKKKKKMGGQKKEKGKNPAELRKYAEEEEEEPLSDDEANPAATPMSPAEPTPQSIFAMSDDPDQPPMPFQRYNAMLAVLRNTLYIYGGIFEHGPKEYTLDDFWSIQLDKMETFTCLRPLDVTIDQNAESDSEDDGDDGEDEGEDEDEEQAEGGSGDEVEAETDVVETPAPEPDDVEEDKNKLRAKANEFLGSSKDSTRSAEDQISTPLPGETLAMFYSRSKDYWAQKAYASSDNKGKLLRRDGFALAEERYASYKPILEEVEKILAEAGLDEEEIKRHPAPFIDFSSLISSLLSLTATQPFQAPPFIGSEVYPYEGIVRNMKAPLASSHDSPEKELDVLNGAQPTSGKINGRGFVMRTTVAICAVLVLLRAHLPSKFVTTSSRNPASKSIIPGIKEDKAYGWKDDIWPIRPQQPWDISTDFAHPRKLKYDVEEGTWLRLDVSRDGEIVFDMLGDLYCLPSDALPSSDGQTRWRAYPILLGVPWDSDPHFSPDGRKLVFRSDAGLGVENIWTMPWRGCRTAALRSYDHDAETAHPLNQSLLQALAHEDEDESWLAQGFKEDDDQRLRRLLREGRAEAHRVTNETYRWVSDARFHPDGDKVIATKWYTSERSLGAGEGWIYEVPLSNKSIKTGDGMRVIGRSLPFGWEPEQYPDQQIGPEQFVWWGKDRLIYSKNVAEESDGAFEYSKDVYKGIYAIFARNLTTGATEKLVSASPGSASRPELSHDGRTLAFVRRVRDKEALVLKDLASGTIRNIWYGLAYDATPISAPMGTYPSFAFTPADDAIVIWAAGSLWRVPLAVNKDGERIGNGEPAKILFKATIEKRIAETRISETDLLKEESRDVQRIRVFKELAVDETGSNAVFRAGGKTVHRSFATEDASTHKTGEKLVPVVLQNATYYSPSFVPHMPNLVIHVRWSDIFLSTFEIADLSRQMAFEVSGGLPLGRYDSPVICECEGLNRHIAFIRRGGDYMTGHVMATANPGIYIGTLTLPSPFGMPTATERTFSIKDIRRVSRMTPKRIKFVDGASKLLAHTSRTASVIDISGEPDENGDYPAETLAEGKMSTEFAVTPRMLNSVKSSAHMRTAPAKVGHAAFVDFFQIYVADGTAVDKPLWSKPGLNATRGLARVSLDGGHDLTWSGDGSTLFWFLGPYLHSLKIDQLKHCRSAIQGDPSTFGIDCVRQYVNVTEVHVYHQSESRRLSDDAFDVAHREEKGEVDPSQNHADILVIINATLVTMATGSEANDIVHDGTIIIQGGVIQLVGRGLVGPQGAKVIDAQGGVVVPGFVDVHAHWNGADTVASSWEQLAFLAYGCTTMHNPSSDTVDTWTERVRVESGLMIGPRIFTTGTVIYGAGEAGYHQDIADDAEARSALIRLKVEAGPYAFSYKNYNIPSRASRQRLIKVAKELEMNVYPEGGMNFDWDLTYIVDGMTTVEHSLPIPVLYDDILTLFSASGTGNTPTHIVNYGGIFGEDYVWAHESLPFDDKLRRFVPHAYLEGLSRSVAAPRDSYQLFNTSASVYEMTKRGLNGNVGAHGEPPVGLNYHEEMWFFSQGGMTPYEVLRSATRSGALSLGLFSSIGSLQEGKLADVLIYPPGAAILDDISLSRDIRFVIKGGRVWDAPTMEEEWPLKGKRPSLPPLSAD